MKSFEQMILEKGKKYQRRFYPLLLKNNAFLNNKYGSILNKLGLDSKGCILDIGCGTGIHLPLLKKYSRCVYGIDSSYILARDAKSYFRNEDGIEIIVSQAERLSLKSGIFDLIFVNDSLIHFDDQEAALTQIKRALKKNGKVVFIEPNIMNPLIGLTLVFFKNGFRALHRNKTKTCCIINKHLIIEEEKPFNLIYTNTRWKIFLANLYDKMTSKNLLAIFSFRYFIIARKTDD